MTYGNLALSDELELYELWIAADNNNGGQQSGFSPLNWGRFRVAGDGPIEDVVGIKILEWQIPASWYVFNEVNNTFLVFETGFTQQTVTIPIGNYTSASIVTALTAALNAASVASGSGNTWTVTFDIRLQKLIFTSSTTDYTFRFGAGENLFINGQQIPTNSGNKNPRLFIGFTAGDTSSIAHVIVSPNVVNLSGPPYLYLNSSLIGPAVHGFLPEGAVNLGRGQAGPQVAKIPVYTNPGGWIFGQDPQPQMYFEFNQNQVITELDFYFTLGSLTSENPLDFRGGIFSLKIGLVLAKKFNQSNVMPTPGNDMVGSRVSAKRHRIS
jgi:hypothetical protein